MQGRKSYGKRSSDMGVALLLFAGLSPFLPLSSRTVRAGDRREAVPIAPALVTAIRDADVRAVRKVINDGADVNARDADGNTPLILASFHAGPECVALLLERGADANAANKDGVTALVRAATNYEKARLLVAAGANVRVRTADLGNTPLILAARRAGIDQGQQADAGRAIFQRLCKSCHGPDGRGTPARDHAPSIPDFTSQVWQQRRRPPELTIAILEGKGTAMPAFRGKLNEAQIRDLVTYLRVFAPQPASASTASATDFKRKFEQLTQELDGLKKQYQDLSKE